MENRWKSRGKKRTGGAGERWDCMKVFVIILILVAIATIPFVSPAPPSPPFLPGAPPAMIGLLIILSSPAESAYLVTSTIGFNVTFNLENVQNCSLILDGAVINTWSSIINGDQKYYPLSGQTGGHQWFVRCVLNDGDIIESEQRSFIVDTNPPSLLLSSTSVERGSFLSVIGEHYLPGEVGVNITNESGDTVQSMVFDASVTAKNISFFNQTVELKFVIPEGSYSVTTWQKDYSAASLSEPFLITPRIVELMTDASSYLLGQSVGLTGTGFSPLTSVKVIFRRPSGQTYERSVPASANGSFSFSYQIAGTQPEGEWTVNATDARYSSLSASASFVVADGEDKNYDKDGVPNEMDNCPMTANPDQRDSDGDGKGDACDPTPFGEQPSSPLMKDYDGDEIPDDRDNCPILPNPYQEDTDRDGIGNACDSKDDSIVDPPNSLDDTGEPVPQQPKSKEFPFLPIAILVLILLLVGIVGYLAYEGKLDVHDLRGSLAALFSPGSKRAGLSSEGADEAHDRLKTFIFSERARGYDDLTIRNALLEIGWSAQDVDGAFQRIYAE